MNNNHADDDNFKEKIMKKNSIKNEKGYCTVYTKFMQNYRLSKSIEMGEQLQSIRNKHNLDDFFCMRTDGYVESFCHNKESSTGYGSVALDIHGSFISSVICDNGDIIVFAVQGEELYFSIKRNDNFETSKKINMDMPYSAIKICGISVRKIGKEIWIAVIMQAGLSESESNLHVLCGMWQNENTILKSSGITVSSSKCMWLLSDESDPVIIFCGSRLVGIHALSGKTENYPSIPVKGNCMDIYSSFDPTAKADIISVVIDKHLYIFNTMSSKWTSCVDSANFTKSRLHYEENIGMHIIALNSNLNVYHGFFSTIDDTFTILSPIISEISDFCISDCNGEMLSVLCADNKNKKVNQMILENSSSNWNIQEIGLKTENDIYEYKSYMTEITAYDSCGLIYPKAEISIWSNEDTRIEINGESVMIGPNNKFSCFTNENGMVYIVQETCMLSVPEIYVSFSNNLKNGKNVFESESVLAISQYSPVQNILKNIDGDGLLNAKKNDGTQLLSEEYRDKETAQSVAEALKECVALIPSSDQNNMLTGEAKWICRECIGTHEKIMPTNVLRHSGGWSLKKEGNRVTYTLKSQEEIDLLLLKAENNDAIVGIGFFKRIGDFLRAVAKKVVEVVEVVVTVVKDTVKTVITYVQDKVEHLFTQIVDTAQQVWDVVESVFNEVKIFFSDVFQWIGYIFNWNDILRTKRMIDYCIDQIFECADSTLEYAESKADSCLDYMKSKISETSDKFVSKLDPNLSFGEILSGNGFIKNDTAIKYNVSNNFLYNQYIYRDVPSISSSENLLAAEPFDSFKEEKDDFLKILSDFVSETEQNDAFKEAIEYFSSVFNSRDNMFNNMLCGLIKLFEGLAVTIVSATKAVVKATFELCRKVVKTIYELLTKEIKLPFLSTLFTKITKEGKLTVSGVFSLIIALPVTIVHKIINKKAPIANEEEFNEFKKYINSDFYKSAICGKQNQNTALTEIKVSSVIAPAWVKSVLQVVNGISSFIYYMASSYVDAASIVTETIIPFSLNLGCFACEAIWALTSAICWFTDPSVAEWVNYGFVCSGVILDLVFLIIERTMPENSSLEYPKVLTFIYGVLFEAATICAICMPSQKPGVSDYILNIVPPLMCCLKIGLLNTLIDLTYGISAMIPVIGGQLTSFVITGTYFSCAKDINVCSNTLFDDTLSYNSV